MLSGKGASYWPAHVGWLVVGGDLQGRDRMADGVDSVGIVRSGHHGVAAGGGGEVRVEPGELPGGLVVRHCVGRRCDVGVMVVCVVAIGVASAAAWCPSQVGHAMFFASSVLIGAVTILRFCLARVECITYQAGFVGRFMML